MTDLLPGTQEAIDAGCLCPIMDNGHGRGYRYGPDRVPQYVYVENCPHHGHVVKAAIAREEFREERHSGDRETESHEPHKLECPGSTPGPATTQPRGGQ